MHSEVGAVLGSVDVVVVPSNCVENSPGTLAEAFAAGTPVIGSDVCGVREHISHGVDGLLFRRGDADDLAGQMQRVAQEPGLLDKLRCGVRAPRELADQVDELVEIYQSLAATGPGIGPVEQESCAYSS